MGFLVPAEVTTERLFLRQWRAEDAEPLHQIYTQPEFLEFMPPLDLEQTREQVASFMRRWSDDGACQWAAVEKTSGRLIGRIGLLRHRDWPSSPEPPIEVGWTLHHDWWGRGLATEGGRAGVESWRTHLLDDKQLLSITRPENVRSRAVMERLGFTMRGETDWRGFHHVWYALDR